MRSFFGFILFFNLILLASCSGKNETIPAYVRIDSFLLNTTPSEGSEVHQIEAVYLYASDGLVGLFELPAVIPVLKNGRQRFTLVPAIRLNGSNNRLAPHSNFVPVDTVLELISSKITPLLRPTLKFRTNTVFSWVEDFEDNNSSLVNASVSAADTTYISSQPFQLNNRFSGSSKVFTGKISAGDTVKFMDLGSFKAFTGLPTDGRDIFLEFDTKSELPIDLVISRTNSNGTELVPYLRIYETGGEWKHFYVNLVFEVGAQPVDTEYKILFSAVAQPSANTRYLHFDNIRLTHLN